MMLVRRVAARNNRQSQKFPGSLDKVGNMFMLSGRHVYVIDLQCSAASFTVSRYVKEFADR